MTTVHDNLRSVQHRLTAAGAAFELHWVEHDGQRLPAYKNACSSLAELVSLGRVHADKVFMVFEDERWTFSRFYAQVDALAFRLRSDFALQPGQRVAIAMRNRPEWAVVFVAVASLGAVPAALNSFGLGDELLAAIGLIEPQLLFVDSERLQRISAPSAPLGCPVVLVGAEPAAGSGPHAYAALCAVAANPLALPDLDPLDPALILFTSGATSQAKGVVSGQRAVCQALYNIDYIGACAAMSSPAALQAIMQRGLPPTSLTVVPLFHVSGLHAQLLGSLRHGRRLVFMRRWEPQAALALMRQERVTQFNGAPSMVLQLLAQPGFDDPAVVGNLSGIGFGGAGLPQRAIDEVLQRVRPSMSGVGFGLTETNGVGSAISGEGFQYRPHSAGLCSPIMQLRLVDAAGADVPIGQPGEVWMRGVSLMQAYWRAPQQSRQALDGGWFRSGDIGMLDAEGFLTIVDRIKDVINRAGEKIAAAEVESCLLQHPDLAEAAVIALPDADTGEAVVAIVVARDGCAPTVSALQAFAAARLASYKRPQRIHIRSSSLPRNPVGKLLKQQLRGEYERDGSGIG